MGLKWLLFLALLWTIGCTGTETGNPSLQQSLTLRARSRDPADVTLGSGQGRIRIDAAWVVLGEVALGECGGPHEPVLDPVATDLAAAPETRSFAHERPSYCALDTGWERSAAHAPAHAPPELPGRSLVVLGRRSDDVPFRLGSTLNLPIQVATPAPGFDLGEPLILAFDVAQWFSAVDLDTATVDPNDSTIRIGVSENAALLALLEASLPASATLHHDANENGLLDPEEQSVIAQ